MTKTEAGEVISLLNAGFHREALEAETVKVWLVEIALLADGEVAVETARRMIRETDHFPSLREFRAAYRAVAEAKRAKVRALEEARRPTRLEEWVYVYKWARAAGELRPFPQQQEWADPDTVMSETEYAQLREQWLKAGTPRNVNFQTVQSM